MRRILLVCGIFLGSLVCSAPVSYTHLVFDLNNLNAKPITLIPKLKAKLKKATSIIGFLNHLQGELLSLIHI